jgi:hypothetical protein
MNKMSKIIDLLYLVDEILTDLEDHTHGAEGDKISKARKHLIDAINECEKLI